MSPHLLPACVRGGLVWALTLIAPPLAAAHSNIDMGDFYAGVTQAIFHWELLLLLLAVALWASQAEEPDDVSTPVGFALALLAGACVALWSGTALGAGGAWTVRIQALVFGLLVALRLRLRGLGLLAGAIAGLTYGWAAVSGEYPDIGKPLLYVAGLDVGAFILFGWVLALTTRFRAIWMQVAIRVLGSWIATISLLISALEWARPNR